ncbi:tRNA (adenosine(37)-N6)-threonylcarbamoyltransferase complex transferase subunit TsaD, partial [Candidatus Aerophobetes bacterium]|nr:tRNA (adenosine(37)-N6)-threonylcarbamoyltransferase complex transferase subunit TsaD [Candidatus Aerophobetes bacterium]
MLILGIETSCDETAAAVVENGKKILSNVVASQVDLHRKFWGIVPEIASRKHLELIIPIIKESLGEARIKLKDLDAVAATYGPGLLGSLLVGLIVTKGLAYALELPFIGINHLEAHFYANFLSYPEIVLPLVGLIISGGHTELIYLSKEREYEILGTTRDDAVGEAFDKVARILDLGYPGGPVIEKMAEKGNPQSINLPLTHFKNNSLDFSFSGIKTAVLYYVKDLERKKAPVS